MAPPGSPTKKQRLTLAQLSSYDDILTDALVDHVYYWTTIRKNKTLYHPSRGIREEEVTSILRNAVIIEKDPEKAEMQLLALNGLKRFRDNLQTDKEKRDFQQHLRRYINIYMPDCPFEVSSTNRYTIDTHEASVTARKVIKKGETVKYLCGVQVVMTEEEEEDVRERRRDFSIVVSSRNKSASLFLGPARFANHDCDSNAKLSTTGNAGMEIIAKREIDIGEEITVTYGENYFGEDNCECLCQSCEDSGLNGWKLGMGTESAIVSTSIEGDEAAPYSLRHKRRTIGSASSSRTPSATPENRLVGRRSTPRNRLTVKSEDQSSQGTPEIIPAYPTEKKRKRGPSKLSEEIIKDGPSQEFGRPSPMKSLDETETKSSEDWTGMSTSRRENVLHDFSSHLRGFQNREDSIRSHSVPSNIVTRPTPSTVLTDASSPSSSTIDGAISTDATSVDDDTIVVKPPTQSYIITSTSMYDPVRDEMTTTSVKSTKLVIAEKFESSAPVPDLVLNKPLPTVIPKIPKKRGRPAKKKVFGNFSSRPPPSDTPISRPIAPAEPVNDVPQSRSSSPEPDAKPIRIRVRGDYKLNRKLLALEASKWNTCDICDEVFVQNDAYCVKSSCPRCERHSKLYGFVWPKTDLEGKWDNEVRITDHRTVHRFIGGKKSWDEAKGDWVRSDNEEEEEQPPEKKSKPNKKTVVQEPKRRGRPPTKTVVEKSIPKKRGRKSKAEIQEAMKALEVTKPKRGRKRKAVEIEEQMVKEPTPKKRAYKRKIIEADDEDEEETAEEEPAPKKRAYKRRIIETDDEDEEETSEEEPAPRKRAYRRRIIETDDEDEEETAEEPITRKRAYKRKTIEADNEDVQETPQKRGRKRRASTYSEDWEEDTITIAERVRSGSVRSEINTKTGRASSAISLRKRSFSRRGSGLLMATTRVSEQVSKSRRKKRRLAVDIDADWVE